MQNSDAFSGLAYAEHFNSLWAGKDDDSDGDLHGGQPYALNLTQRKVGATKTDVLTGFYTLKGERCLELSPFLGPLQRQRVPPLLKTSNDISMNSNHPPVDLGQAYPGIPASSELHINAQNNQRHFPATNEEKFRCPILVRAALVVKCPQSPRLTFTDATGKVRCSSASSIKIELAIEQLYEIAGQRPMSPIYSSLDESRVGTLNVKRLIKSQ